MDTEQVQEAMKEMITKIRRTSFVQGYHATDEEVMGMVLSKYFEWDGQAILKSAMFATEDANFHQESAVIAGMVEKLEERVASYQAKEGTTLLN